MPLLVLLVLIPLAVIALMPVALVQRIRRGTVRRQARGWVVTANLVAVTFSLALFLVGALIATRWAPETLTYVLGGLGVGAVLGLFGFTLTRWDIDRGRLHYTPNRWLVLTMTLVVTARVIYSFWRMGVGLRASVDQMALVAASGLALSMAAGAVILGYYLVYWVTVRRRLRSSGSRA